jgi:hypothetical protein
MSQRLHIGPTDDPVYDCVIASTEGVMEKLMADWLCMNEGDGYLGPWKIRIGDLDLWRKIEPTVAGLFRDLGRSFPDEIWAFYMGDRRIENPTAEQLSEWLAAS